MSSSFIVDLVAETVTRVAFLPFTRAHLLCQLSLTPGTSIAGASSSAPSSSPQQLQPFSFDEQDVVQRISATAGGGLSRGWRAIAFETALSFLLRRGVASWLPESRAPSTCQRLLRLFAFALTGALCVPLNASAIAIMSDIAATPKFGGGDDGARGFLQCTKMLLSHEKRPVLWSAIVLTAAIRLVEFLVFISPLRATGAELFLQPRAELSSSRLKRSSMVHLGTIRSGRGGRSSALNPDDEDDDDDNNNDKQSIRVQFVTAVGLCVPLLVSYPLFAARNKVIYDGLMSDNGSVSSSSSSSAIKATFDLLCGAVKQLWPSSTPSNAGGGGFATVQEMWRGVSVHLAIFVMTRVAEAATRKLLSRYRTGCKKRKKD